MLFNVGDIVEINATDFTSVVDSGLTKITDGYVFEVVKIGETLKGTPHALRAIVKPYRNLPNAVESSPLVEANNSTDLMEIPISLLKTASPLTAAKNRKTK